MVRKTMRWTWRDLRVQEQDGKCFYCGTEFRDDMKLLKPTIDHYVPLARGGRDAYHNTVAACYRCNQLKKERMGEELNRKERKALKYHMSLLQNLADILGVEINDLPPVFQYHCKKKVLKCGIRDDLLEWYPDADKSALSLWLARWTGTRGYIQQVANGKNRHDLDGNDFERITDGHRKHAEARLKKLRKPKQSAKPMKQAA